jgi:hypothetical protein
MGLHFQEHGDFLQGHHKKPALSRMGGPQAKPVFTKGGRIFQFKQVKCQSVLEILSHLDFKKHLRSMSYIYISAKGSLCVEE